MKTCGAGAYLKPDKVKRYMWAIKKYLLKDNIKDDTEDIEDYYGVFTEERADNAYITLMDEYQDISPTLEQLRTRFKQLLQDFMYTNELWQKWYNRRQTIGENLARISKNAGELGDLNGALRQDSISEYA